MEPYTVYYVGEYPPPHFEGNYKTDKEWVGKEIYGMRDPRGERHWVFQYAGDECAARQELSRANST